jgi:hypothetical protein
MKYFIEIVHKMMKLHVASFKKFTIIFFHEHIFYPSLLNSSGIGLHVSLHQMYIHNMHYTEQLQLHLTG